MIYLYEYYVTVFATLTIVYFQVLYVTEPRVFVEDGRIKDYHGNKNELNQFINLEIMFYPRGKIFHNSQMV